MHTSWKTALATLALLPAASLAQLGSDPSSRGFAFSYFWFAMQESKLDCPEGYAMALRDVAIMDLPAEEQARLVSPPHRSEYYQRGYLLGRQRVAQVKGASICEEMSQFNDPPHTLVTGPHAFGMNLDGLDSSGENADSCPQLDFTSPDGSISGIDNQLYRVMGCISSYRSDALYSSGSFEDYHVGAYYDGEVTTLLQITGIDDPKNDDEVSVGVYTGMDPTPYSQQKQALAHASITATDNPLWRNEGKGKIVDGVLTTEPFDIRLSFDWAGRGAEYYFKGAVVQLTLNEDGTASGMLAGYFDRDAAYKHMFRDSWGELQVPYGFTCPAVSKALDENADGYRDPDTGKCTALSTAFKIEAVPAFVIQPDKVLDEPYYPTAKTSKGPSAGFSASASKSEGNDE